MKMERGFGRLFRIVRVLFSFLFIENQNPSSGAGLYPAEFQLLRKST